ncbi:MAG: putative sulfate exporter family transporter [Chitinophagaceae bacterium]|nr:putative sulfate exporter family transporter [Chitinophagaceae bacterium]MCW5927657.1 putative sulfate exporter family transporter [Chitinophagaceae bacterium]
MSSSKKAFSVSEDWTVVILGFTIIILAIAGMKFTAPVFDWDGFSQLGSIFSTHNLGAIGALFLITFLAAIAAFLLTGKSIKNILYVFPVVFLLTLIALVLSGNKTIKETNFETVIFSLALGLLVSNTIKLPAWFKETLTTELFVKIGLVLLGTSVIFGDVLKAGSKGLLQAVLVVISVWYFAYWICKKLKVDEELSMMLSSAVSICGVSAAIATAGAIKGDSKKLSYVVSVVLLTAVPMMIFMPYIANYFHFPEAVTGAWLGGTIDTTGAVVASGSLVGEEALKISTIVKFSQNVLLGIAAFAISVYWTYTKKEGLDADSKPTLKMIWERFPKFVVGFLAASLLFSFLLSPDIVKEVKAPLKQVQSAWFALAFTSIGLETNFRELLQLNNLKPLYAFLIAQLFNILITLVIAMFLFS